MTYNEKSVRIFGRTISVFVLALVALAGVGSAAILAYYGSIVGSVTVEQAVLVDGAPADSLTSDYSGSNVAGTTLTDGEHDLTNNAQVPATIKFQTIQSGDGSDDGAVDGITTSYNGVLELTMKDITTWQPISGTEKEVKYTLVGTTFVATADIPTGYELVYAMDKQNRFNPSNYATVFRLTGDIGSLPKSQDWNLVASPNYCGNANGFDNYKHCVGAKLWMVPTSDIAATPETDGSYKLSWANMDEYYYETDLIAYSANGNNQLTLPANGGGVNFEIVNDFNLALTPGAYTITTNILPVV